jgi:hypothetical protein
MQTIVHNFVYGTTRNVLAGASLCYAIENEKYIEIPLIIFFPSIYAGYNLFKNKDEVIKVVKSATKRTIW